MDDFFLVFPKNPVKLLMAFGDALAVVLLWSLLRIYALKVGEKYQERAMVEQRFELQKMKGAGAGSNADESNAI